MVLNISESGLLLEGAPMPAAGPSGQAFAITLSRSAIEDMIACVQNGGDLQLSMGAIPVSAIERLRTPIVCYSELLHNTAAFGGRLSTLT